MNWLSGSGLACKDAGCQLWCHRWGCSVRAGGVGRLWGGASESPVVDNVGGRASCQVPPQVQSRVYPTLVSLPSPQGSRMSCQASEPRSQWQEH